MISFFEFQNSCQIYGCKGAGLLLLPRKWTPDFFLVEVSHFEAWLDDPNGILGICDRITDWANSSGHEEIILRTSGRHETIRDRGRYKSIVLNKATSRTVETAILEIYSSCKASSPLEQMGIVAQRYVHPHVLGHLSNELRVSPTRNQWQLEVESPANSRKGINSKFANAPHPDDTLRVRGISSHPFRSVANWCTSNLGPRCHLEWLVQGSNLWLVQLDLEWREQEIGVDPAIATAHMEFKPSSVHSSASLTPYVVGSATRWRKLRNLNDFDFPSSGFAPRIYECSAHLIEIAAQSTVNADRLAEEIDTVTGGKVVVRVDVDQPEFPRYNLPRTDTVSGKDAVEWAVLNLKSLVDRGALAENVAFLLHGFIPAKASAWAFASPDSPEVYIDALWGLPDGIQVLPVDTYEVIPNRNRIIDTKSTFKPMFLAEGADGRWKYVQVATSKGRSKVLQNSDALEIARRTKAISDKLGEPAQVMWFCQIDPLCELGRNLPWFRTSDLLGEASKSEDKYFDYVVADWSDLDCIPTRKVSLVYRPAPHLIRSDDFLESVVQKAKDLGYPVKLFGSILGHVYYRLCQENIPVILPNASRYKRVRDRRVFGKIVRDLVPSNIHSGGESVREATLSKVDFPVGLTGKLFEEAEEFLTAGTLNEKVSELADMFEILRGLALHLGMSFDEVIRVADVKRHKVGGFEERRVLLETSLPRAQQSSDLPQEVSLSSLFRIGLSESSAAIPLSMLLTTVGMRPVEFVVSGAGVSVRCEMKKGILEFSVRPVGARGQDKGSAESRQLSFFDDGWADGKN